MIITQTWLIERILLATNMEECNRKYTPAEKIPLGKDKYGGPCREDWKYRSVVRYQNGIIEPDLVNILGSLQDMQVQLV